MKIAPNNYSKLGYLSGVERSELDFRDLISIFKDEDVFWIVDPPYEERPNGEDTYKNEGYISIDEAIEMFGSFVYFCSGKNKDVDCGIYEYRRVNTLGYNMFTDIMLTTVPPNNVSIFDYISAT